MTPKRYSIVLSVFLGLVILAGGGAYYWMLGGLHKSTAELGKRLADQQLTQDKLEKLQNLNKQYKQLQPLVGDMDEALPKSKQQSELALQLQQLAAVSGMSLSGLNFAANTTLPTATSQTVKQGDVLAIPVSFTLTGTYAQLQTFLQHQERLSRYTSVSTLTIARSDKGLTFSITLNAFVKP